MDDLSIEDVDEVWYWQLTNKKYSSGLPRDLFG